MNKLIFLAALILMFSSCSAHAQETTTVIQGVNTAGSVQVNYLAEFERMIPPLIYGSFICSGAIFAAKGKRKTGAKMIGFGFIVLVSSPFIIGFINWLIASVHETP